MVNVGIVGLGPDWESRYLPVLRKLRRRIVVRAIYDSICGKAHQSAAEFSADVAESLSQLAHRPDIRAVLLLDPAWHGHCALELLQPSRKPIFIGSHLTLDAEDCKRWHRMAADEGQTLMPALGLRYTPASMRLQELMATRLGRACEIHIDARLADDGSPPEQRQERARRLLMELIDWTRYFARTRPATISSAVESDADGDGWPDDWTVHVQFGLRKSGGPPAMAGIRLKANISPSANAPDGEAGAPDAERRPIRPSEWLPYHQASSVRLCFTGEKGTAVIESPTHIHWKSAASADPHSERLLSERSEVEVMLDHFCRRVVGGLIPVADFGDLSLALAVIQAAERSRSHGQSVPLGDDPPLRD